MGVCCSKEISDEPGDYSLDIYGEIIIIIEEDIHTPCHTIELSNLHYFHHE
jgi:hypothetical protein